VVVCGGSSGCRRLLATHTTGLDWRCGLTPAGTSGKAVGAMCMCPAHMVLGGCCCCWCKSWREAQRTGTVWDCGLARGSIKAWPTAGQFDPARTCLPRRDCRIVSRESVRRDVCTVISILGTNYDIRSYCHGRTTVRTSVFSPGPGPGARLRYWAGRTHATQIRLEPNGTSHPTI
jgi:hypothetical protein